VLMAVMIFNKSAETFKNLDCGTKLCLRNQIKQLTVTKI